MSYRSYVGAPLTGYTSNSYGYPQTYMANDILALQTMYGADYMSYSENTVYTWSATTGQMSIDGVVNWRRPGRRRFGQPRVPDGLGRQRNRYL